MAKVGVVVFPGSNCDDDAVHVASEVSGRKAVKLWHKDRDLQGCDVIIVPGGFSYGDYLRCGAIARFSPIMESVAAHAKSSRSMIFPTTWASSINETGRRGRRSICAAKRSAIATRNAGVSRCRSMT